MSSKSQERRDLAERVSDAKVRARLYQGPGAADTPANRREQTDIVNKLARESYLRARNVDPAGPFQLSIWPDSQRAIPNDFARSALFTVRNKREPRQALQQLVLPHVEKNVKITFTGIELRAEDDELVWQQILNYAKYHELGKPIDFNLKTLLDDLGWSINQRNYDKARKCISRLKASEVKVENEQYGVGAAVSLIDHYEFWDAKGSREGSATRYRVSIHPMNILYFAGNTFTLVNWESYRGLTPLARRLIDYAGSHKNPFALRLEKFKEICCSTTQDKHKWKQMVLKAGDELREAGLLEKVYVHEQKIFFER